MSNIATAKKFPIYTESGVEPTLDVLEEQALAFNIADGKLFTRYGSTIISLGISAGELAEALQTSDTELKKWIGERIPTRLSLNVDKVANYSISDSYGLEDSKSYASSRAVADVYLDLLNRIKNSTGENNADLSNVRNFGISDNHMLNLSTSYASSKALTTAYNLLNYRIATTRETALLDADSSKQYTDNAIANLPEPANWIWQAFADDIEGGGISLSSVGKAYVGFSTGKVNATADISDPAVYTWGLFRGKDGISIKGDPGVSAFLHIAYADTALGGGFSQLATGKPFVGTYTDDTLEDSTDPVDYKWSSWKGLKGDQGDAPEVIDNDDGTYTIIGLNGSIQIADGANPTLTDNGDGTKTISDGSGNFVIVSDGYTPIKGAGKDYNDGNNGDYVSFAFIQVLIGSPIPTITNGTYNGTTEIIPVGWSDDPTFTDGYTTYVAVRRYSHDVANSVWTPGAWSIPAVFAKKGETGVATKEEIKAVAGWTTLPFSGADVTDYNNQRISNGQIALDFSGYLSYIDDTGATINLGAVTASGIGAETPAAAQAKVDLAKVQAEAYADGIVTDEESRAIADATSKADAAVALSNGYTDTKLVNYVTDALRLSDKAELQGQIDNSITTWFLTGAPTAANAPTVDWTTDTDRNVHLGDLYYDNDTGYAYRYKIESTVYSWVKVSDSDVTLALANASKAQDTADSKRRVFVGQPVPPYDTGDLWDSGTGVYRATVPRAAIDIYVGSDWIQISDNTNYSDSRVSNVDAAVAARSYLALLQPTSVTPDGNFTDPDFWSNRSGSINAVSFIQTTVGIVATTAVRHDTAVGAWLINNRYQQATPGEKYKLSAWFKRSTLSDRSGYLVLSEYDALGAEVRYTYLDVTTSIPKTETWTYVEWMYTVPSNGTVTIRPGLALNHNGGTVGWWEAQGFKCEPLNILNEDAVNTAAIDAQAKATLARTTAEAYADDIVTAEEARAIADATSKANTAEGNAKAASDALGSATAAQNAAITAAATDASSKANAAQTAAISSATTKVAGITLSSTGELLGAGGGAIDLVNSTTIEGGLIPYGTAKYSPVTAGNSILVSDTAATDNLARAIWRGWGSAFNTSRSSGSPAMGGLIPGRKYRIFCRARKIGTLASMSTYFYNSTKSAYVTGSVEIRDLLQTAYTVIELATFTHNWSLNDNVYIGWGSSGSSATNDINNCMVIDWISVVPVDEANETVTGATAKADAAKAAAISTADAAATTKANLAQTTAEAYADGIVTDEESRAILDATAKANAAEAAAKAASDVLGSATAAKNAAIATASTDASNKSTAAETAAKLTAIARSSNQILYSTEGAFVTTIPVGSPYAKGRSYTAGASHYSSADLIPVTRGETLYLEMWGKQTGSTARAYMGIERYDRNKKPIASNSGCVYVGLSNTLLSTTWTKYVGVTTLPVSHTAYNGSDGAEVAYVRVRILFNYNTTGQAYYAGFKLTRRTDWNEVVGSGRPANNATVGGTIGTNIGGAFNSGNIQSFFAASVIGASLIDVTDLFAQNITATGSITGATLQTSSGTTKDRTIMDNDTIRHFHAGSTVPIMIVGSTYSNEAVVMQLGYNGITGGGSYTGRLLHVSGNWSGAGGANNFNNFGIGASAAFNNNYTGTNTGFTVGNALIAASYAWGAAIRTHNYGSGAGLRASSVNGVAADFVSSPTKPPFTVNSALPVVGLTGQYLMVEDTRGSARPPNIAGYRMVSSWFSNQENANGGDWASGISVKGWENAYASWQLSSSSSTAVSNVLKFRTGVNTAWNSWLTVGMIESTQTWTGVNTFNKGYLGAGSTGVSPTTWKALMGTSSTLNNFLFGGHTTGSQTAMEHYIRIGPNLLQFTSSAGTATIWNSLNDGSGSGLDADKLDGLHAVAASYSANQIAARDTGGDVFARLFRSNYANQSTISGAIAYRINTTDNSYVRYCSSPSAIRTWLGVPATSGNVATATWADTVDINTSTATAFYNMTWHSGDTMYSASSGGGLTYRPSDGFTKIKHGYFAGTYIQHDTTGKIVARHTDKRSAGMYGLWVSSRVSHIWSMGTGYKVSDTGANFGNLYGLAFKHTTNTTGGTMGGSYQMVWCINGTGTCAMGTNIWTSGNVTAKSDGRVKVEREVIKNALGKIDMIAGYTYRRTDVPGPRQAGVIAQEVLRVLPEVVFGSLAEGYSVSYGNMVALLVEGIKELRRDNLLLREEFNSFKTEYFLLRAA